MGAFITVALLNNYYTGGLVGYWTFNGQDMDWGSSTAEALDRSGNNNNGNVTNFGQEGAVIGQVGQALEFDGVNDYVEIYSSGELIAQNTISICAWIKRDQVTGPSQINIFVQNDTDSGNGYVTHQFAINGANGKLLYDNWLPNDGTLYSDDPLTAGVWQYVCVTRNNNEVIFYIDGGQSGGGTGETRQSAGEIDNVTIGARYYDNSPQWPFDGLIDEVRIYNRALSAEEIQNLYQAGARKFQVNTPITQKLTSGLVGHWTFNGQDMDWASSTAEALDRSGNSNNGNVVNGATPTIGISGQAFEFDGTDDYVDCGSDSSLNIIGDLTIMVWVKLPSPQVDTGYNHLDIFGAANPYSPYEGYILAVHRTTSKLAFFTADGGWDYSQGTILDDTWHQVAGVLNGSTVTFYIDGLASGSEASSAPTSYTGKKAIGANNEGNARINGIIDEVRVYNRALSAEEIQELYRAGSRGATIKN